MHLFVGSLIALVTVRQVKDTGKSSERVNPVKLGLRWGWGEAEVWHISKFVHLTPSIWIIYTIKYDIYSTPTYKVFGFGYPAIVLDGEMSTKICQIWLLDSEKFLIKFYIFLYIAYEFFT